MSLEKEQLIDELQTKQGYTPKEAVELATIILRKTEPEQAIFIEALVPSFQSCRQL